MKCWAAISRARGVVGSAKGGVGGPGPELPILVMPVAAKLGCKIVAVSVL